MTRLSKIELRIAQATDKRVLRVLNLAWWAEFLGLWPKKQERKAA